MRIILESVRIAADVIWANKLRSFLTVLGNIVAVTSTVAVVSLIQGLNVYVGDRIVSGVGANAFTIQRIGITTTDEEVERAQKNPEITLQEAEHLRRSSPLVAAVMAQSQARGVVRYRDRQLERVMIQGVSRDYIQFSTFDAERGRLISPAEVDRRRLVAILGYETAERLFGAGDPLDQVVRIEGKHFRVVGVSERKGSLMGTSQDEFAVIPLGAFQKLFGSRQPLSLMVRPHSPSRLAQTMDETTVALRVERGLKPSDPDNFGVFSSDTIIDLYQQATTGLFAVLIGVVALSVVVGGIVIMNIMLMAVTQRTREMGLRKALGATRRDILTQVLTESVTLSTCGGLVGIALGFVAARLLSALSPISARVEWWSVALGIGITVAAGVFFGAYPASRAARLDPIEALRRE